MNKYFICLYVQLVSLHFRRKKILHGSSTALNEETRNGHDSNVHIAGQCLTELQKQSHVLYFRKWPLSEWSTPFTLQHFRSPNFSSGVLSKFAFIPLPPPKFLCAFGKKKVLPCLWDRRHVENRDLQKSDKAVSEGIQDRGNSWVRGISKWTGYGIGPASIVTFVLILGHSIKHHIASTSYFSLLICTMTIIMVFTLIKWMWWLNST